MTSQTLSQNIVQKFREEYLTAVSPIIEQASSVSLAQRWDILFQCSIAPKPEWMASDLLATMLDLFQVSSYDQLLPKYLGNEEQWGAIVSPRVGTSTGETIAFIEHWFVTQSTDLEHVVQAVLKWWPLPFQAISISLSPQHRCAGFFKEGKNVRLTECAYVASWNGSKPEKSSSSSFKEYTYLTNQALNVWWPDLCRELNRNDIGRMPEREMTTLRKGMDLCEQTGGTVNVYDDQGIAAHVSWCEGSEAELLIPQCWNVPYIFVRNDLRGQGLAKHVYALAAQNMVLDQVPLVCARVQADNLPSIGALEAVGAERVLEYYIVG